MPYAMYVEREFREETLHRIHQANAIIAEYQRQGFDLTLRQLYYQFVARGLLANTQRNYQNLGSIVNNGRLAGLIDWEAIEDRTRNLQERPHYADPGDLIEAAANWFFVDRWVGQQYRPEVWVEKEALEGVFLSVCRKWDVPVFSCRGYTSQSEMWRASQRFIEYREDGREPLIFHFGDHDPSGIDMTRDIEDRLELFVGPDGIFVERLALNIDQVRKHNPPPNPAKSSDSRFRGYTKKFGKQSWELDALEPRILVDLAEREIKAAIDDQDAWNATGDTIDRGREELRQVGSRYREVWKFLKRKGTGK